MKNILIPTDFSENARKALDFGLALAQQFNATIHILHAYHTTSHAGHLSNINRVVKEDREQELETFLAKVKEDSTFDIAIQGRCRKGYAVELIEQEAEKVAADLIIMGTLGASSIEKKLLGSVTSNVIKNSKTPVLAVPKNVEYENLENIILAVDALTMSNVTTLDMLVYMAQKSDLVINMVHVANQQTDSNIDPRVENYLEDMSVAYSYAKIESDEVLEGVLDFAHTKANSMLCLVSRQRTWLENLFHNSISQQIALQSDLPILVLQDVIA